MIRRRWSIALFAALAAIVLVFVYWQRSDGERSQSTNTASRPQDPPAAPARNRVTPTQHAIDDDVPPALPPPDYKPAERPPLTPMTQQAYIERRTKGLKLLDDTIARVERERDDANKAGNADAAAFAQRRLDRLAAAREQRAHELEQAKRGELRPNPDDLPAGPRPTAEGR